MEESTYQVIWDRNAEEALRTIVDHIRQDSDQAADKVKKKISEVTSSLSKMPERYPLESALAHLPDDYRYQLYSRYFVI